MKRSFLSMYILVILFTAGFLGGCSEPSTTSSLSTASNTTALKSSSQVISGKAGDWLQVARDAAIREYGDDKLLLYSIEGDASTVMGIADLAGLSFEWHYEFTTNNYSPLVNVDVKGGRVEKTSVMQLTEALDAKGLENVQWDPAKTDSDTAVKKAIEEYGKLKHAGDNITAECMVKLVQKPSFTQAMDTPRPYMLWEVYLIEQNTKPGCLALISAGTGQFLGWEPLE